MEDGRSIGDRECCHRPAHKNDKTNEGSPRWVQWFWGTANVFICPWWRYDASPKKFVKLHVQILTCDAQIRLRIRLFTFWTPGHGYRYVILSITWCQISYKDFNKFYFSPIVLFKINESSLLAVLSGLLLLLFWVVFIRSFLFSAGVKPKRLSEGLTPRHCALSLVGEPIMYPEINTLVDELHRRRISTFLVTNAQFPERIRMLRPITQVSMFRMFFVEIRTIWPEVWFRNSFCLSFIL